MERLLKGCKISPIAEALHIYAPVDDPDAFSALKSSFRFLAQFALDKGAKEAVLHHPSAEKPYIIPGYMAFDLNNVYDPNSRQPSSPPGQSSSASISTYAPSRIDPDATYDQVEDFVRGMKAAGKIVTIMSMNDRNPAKNDLFLKVNDLQIQHRAGGWKMNDWVGTDAKSTVWVRSFDGTLPKVGMRESGHNYYQELIKLLRAGEAYIPAFEYLIDRPNNAGLWLDITDYHFVRDYGGTAIRIAVSEPGNSTLVEAYQ